MKKFIDKINNYLIERYPTIWNTKLFWVFIIALPIHIGFFVMGTTALSDPNSLTFYNAESVYFKNGTLLFSVLISLVFVVLWLVALFKNNAFKSFYPVSRLRLFGSFLLYIFILFIVTTFYFSYALGYKCYISAKYPDSVVKAEVAKSNLAAVFLEKDIADYNLDQRSYPSPFDTLRCVKSSGIDSSKPYITISDESYQFFSMGYDTIPMDQYNKKIFKRDYYTFDSYNEKYMIGRYRIVHDVSAFVKDSAKTLYNYSNVRFPHYLSRNDDSYTNYNGDKSYPKERVAINKKVYELLKRNDPNEIKKVLTDMLAIAHKYDVATNLTTDLWFGFVYDPPGFLFKNFNLSEKYQSAYGKSSADYTVQEVGLTDGNSKYYFNDTDLGNVFSNLERIKSSDFVRDMFLISVWIAFGLASILFAFRITGLRPLLFSVVSSAVISVIIGLIVVMMRTVESLSVMWIIFVVATAIIIIPIFLSKISNKLVQGICVTMTITGIVLYFLLIILMISFYQDDYSRRYNYNHDNYHSYYSRSLIDWLGFNCNYVLWVAGLIFMFLYISIIKKWKALPE